MKQIASSKLAEAQKAMEAGKKVRDNYLFYLSPPLIP